MTPPLPPSFRQGLNLNALRLRHPAPGRPERISHSASPSPFTKLPPIPHFLRPLVGLLTCLLLSSSALAHQVPSLTLEADFSPDGAVEFRVNLDPRLFLAEDPTTLPPVPAPWFRDQTEEARAQTLADATAYVQAALSFFFDDQKTAALTWKFEPIDGATGEPFTDATAEVHFLAKCQTRRPDTASASSVRLETAAKAAAVILNRLNQQAERRPQILFPGETSRPFRCLPD